MVDMVPQTEAELDPAAKSGAAERKGFFGTTNGKITLAAIALLVLIILAGVALFMFMAQGPSTDQTSVDSVSVSAPTEEAVKQPVEPAEQPLSDTFIFRNIFKPSVKAPAPPKSTTSNATAGDGDEAAGPTAGVDELLLVSIGSADGERTATFLWNGETYVLSSGDTIPNTPWKVVDISADSVSVIYGDSSPIVLSVGASISK